MIYAPLQLEQVSNPQIISVSFAPSKLSKFEMEIMKTFVENKTALTSGELHNLTISRFCTLRYTYLKKNFPDVADLIEKEILRNSIPNSNDKRKIAETWANALRKVEDVPTYPRFLHLLNSLASVGWIEQRFPTKQNTKNIWSIPDDIRKKMKKFLKK